METFLPPALGKEMEIENGYSKTVLFPMLLTQKKELFLVPRQHQREKFLLFNP